MASDSSHEAQMRRVEEVVRPILHHLAFVPVAGVRCDLDSQVTAANLENEIDNLSIALGLLAQRPDPGKKLKQTRKYIKFVEQRLNLVRSHYRVQLECLSFDVSAFQMMMKIWQQRTYPHARVPEHAGWAGYLTPGMPGMGMGYSENTAAIQFVPRAGIDIINNWVRAANKLLGPEDEPSRFPPTGHRMLPTYDTKLIPEFATNDGTPSYFTATGPRAHHGKLARKIAFVVVCSGDSERNRAPEWMDEVREPSLTDLNEYLSLLDSEMQPGSLTRIEGVFVQVCDYAEQVDRSADIAGTIPERNEVVHNDDYLAYCLQKTKYREIEEDM